MLQNYADNDDKITAHNALGASFEMGHNQFSHLSEEEFSNRYLLLFLKVLSFTHNFILFCLMMMMMMVFTLYNMAVDYKILSHTD
jgi:hypothetical protein